MIFVALSLIAAAAGLVILYLVRNAP